MEIRLASKEDLPQIKAVYRAIIEAMYKSGIEIWDEVYPCEFFAEDVERGRLYVLVEDSEIAAAFALCDSHDGACSVQWTTPGASAMYLDRLGVSVSYGRQGVGSRALKEAQTLARAQGAEYLRLFVVDENQPAINFYVKNGFSKASGVFNEVIDVDLTLREFGFERETSRYE